MVFPPGAVVPTRGRRATLPARPPRPPAAARAICSAAIGVCRLFRVHLILVLAVVRANTREDGVHLITSVLLAARGEVRLGIELLRIFLHFDAIIHA